MHLSTHTLILSILICWMGALPSGTVQAEVVNLEFRDNNGDGMPDGWKPFPAASGELTLIEMKGEDGVRFMDTDPNNGLGLEQWVTATPGTRYRLAVTPAGTGGCFLYLTFAPRIPAKAADLGKIQLAQTREWISAAREGVVEAVAPQGATLAQIWVYSPKDNAKCDLVLNTIVLTTTDGTAAKPATSEASAASPVKGLANSSFNGMEGWQVFPAANGSGTRIEVLDGGLKLFDSDASAGVGLQQWVPVSSGSRYRVTLQTEGSGGAFLYMIYASEIPARASDQNRFKLSEKREWVSAGKEIRMEAEAPEGAKFLQLWIYSPRDNNRCEMIVKEIRLEEAATGIAPSALPPPPPDGAASYPHYNPSAILPVGAVSVIDFETGDMSQVRSVEGGEKGVVSSPEPVRHGKHAMKVQMDHKNIRTEITGLRSAAFGEYKYGWSVYIPEDFDADSSFSIVTQWHDWGSGLEYPADGGPPTSMYIANNTWRLKLRYQDGDQLKTTSKEFTFGSIDANRGKWTDFYLEVNWQSPQTGGGYYRLYKDGERVIDYEGPTWFDGKVQGPFFKMGIYKGAGSWKGDADRTYMYFDEFRMGDASATRKQVDLSQQK